MSHRHGTLVGMTRSTTTSTTTSETTPAAADVRRAAAALIVKLAGAGAVARDDQVEAVAALVAERRRVLVVQRTGWGKSAVYFVAARLLREAGAGPTLLVSPLLALMRDQVAAAARIGLRAATVNSTNVDSWGAIEADLRAGRVDLLLVSPERLASPHFRDDVLPSLIGAVGLLVVDEAHCISDWGHDFRPDYRRIGEVLARLGEVPVLATTATANDRVVADVAAQLGADPLTLRGRLDRRSLALAVVDAPDAATRLAWLADWIPTTAGSGIAYCLTVADAELLARWLRERGVHAAAYTGQAASEERERLEADLKTDSVKVLCATTALGMGYDKPDVAFVVHVGLPSSPVAYYQAIGRAGRALDRADVVALPGRADEAIWDFFESTALPSEEAVQAIVAALDRSAPTSTVALEHAVNLRRTRLEAALKVLDVEGVVARRGSGWVATGTRWAPDPERLARVAAARHAERGAMRAYVAAPAEGRCLMRSLLEHLDDPDVAAGPTWRCGRCQGCGAPTAAAFAPQEATVGAARRFLRSRTVVVEPRKQWPSGLDGVRGRIGPDVRAEEGRALAYADDAGWSDVVDVLLAAGADPGDPAVAAALEEAVDGLTRVLAGWHWASRPTWVTWVPSRTRPWLPRTLAERLGALGRLRVVDAVRRAAPTRPQARMANSLHQARNALEGLAVDAAAVVAAPRGPVLLVDDTTASGWTLTVVAAALRRAGADAVLPVVLHRRP